MTERQLKEQGEQLLAVAINSFTRAVRQNAWRMAVYRFPRRFDCLKRLVPGRWSSTILVLLWGSVIAI
jgi:hypothetical protein